MSGAEATSLRVMVTGSREWAERTIIRMELARLCGHPVVLVHGDARGADRECAAIAESLGFTTEGHPADWGAHGRAAGPIRNREMLDSGIDLVLAFHVHDSRGTADAVREARRRGIPTRRWWTNTDYPSARLEISP